MKNIFMRLSSACIAIMLIITCSGCKKLNWNGTDDRISTYDEVNTEVIEGSTEEFTEITVDLDALRKTNSMASGSEEEKNSLGDFKLLSPDSSVLMTDTLSPTFSWESCSGAKSYTFLIEQYDIESNSYISVLKRPNIKTTTFELPINLRAGGIYRWQVTAVSDGYIKSGLGSFSDTVSNVFMAKITADENEVNKGLGFGFDSQISEQVLKNYLSRSITYAREVGEQLTIANINALRTILYTGAKYISRAASAWTPSFADQQTFDYQKQFIELAHNYDSDIVFEACIFENITIAVNEIAIPKYVFEDFGLNVESRNFSYEKMLFSDGTYVNYFGNNASVPDITKTETQMFFYFRMCEYIKSGFEAFHMGQIEKIGAKDTNWACYTKLLNMVRNYAKTNARRHFVMFNAHTTGIVGNDGLLLLDFHSMPCRPMEPENAVAHSATENNPQEAVLDMNPSGSSIYGKSLGGTTHSGWSTASLPYYVEVDNYSFSGQVVDKPNRGTMWVWGRDEISWFANQPASYRRYWLSYAYGWVRNNDSVGYFCMPACRSATVVNGINTRRYLADSALFSKNGFSDYEAIRNAWLANMN